MQKRDSYQKIEDFLADASFRNWVKGNEDPANWSEWTVENPIRAKLVEEARLWILAMKVEHTPISDQEINQELKTIWKQIGQDSDEPSAQLIRRLKWIKAAAAILIVGVVSILYYNNFLSNQPNSTITYQELINNETDGLIEQTNNSNKPLLITLSDASSVLLQPKSKLSYPKIFIGNERRVYLSGEGFFEISKDPHKPFYVYANETVTKVYGTSFRIVAFPNQSIVEVLVRTGKVKVSEIQKSKYSPFNEVTLYPNQAARFERYNQVFEKISDLTKDESLLLSAKSIERLNFEFRDTPVSQIFATIEQAYIVSIDFPSEKLMDCYLTTSLIDEPLSEKLKIICESLGNGTRYEMHGNQIKIISNGCN